MLFTFMKVKKQRERYQMRIGGREESLFASVSPMAEGWDKFESAPSEFASLLSMYIYVKTQNRALH